MNKSVRNVYLNAFILSLSSLITLAHAECNLLVKNSTVTENFVDLGNGTVEDKLSGLVWSKCSAGQSWSVESNLCIEEPGAVSEFLWQEALVFAENLNLAGHSEWRLPNKKELASIVEYACFDAAIDEQFFPQTQSANFWTATPLPYTQPLKAVAIDFSQGAFNSLNATNALAKVRVVYSK